MQRLTELLGCKGLDVLLGVAIAVADDILTDKDDENITPTDLARTRIALSDTVNALTAIGSDMYPSPKWTRERWLQEEFGKTELQEKGGDTMTQELTQEQKREKLRALLATTVNAIVAAKDEITKIESGLIEARSVAQEAIAELETEYI